MPFFETISTATWSLFTSSISGNKRCLASLAVTDTTNLLLSYEISYQCLGWKRW